MNEQESREKPTPLELLPETGKTSVPPTPVLRVDKSPFPPFQISITKEEREEMERELEKHRRTPEELKIANDAWFARGPGEATP
jgi:hypothetical protein